MEIRAHRTTFFVNRKKCNSCPQGRSLSGFLRLWLSAHLRPQEDVLRP